MPRFGRFRANQRGFLTTTYPRFRRCGRDARAPSVHKIYALPADCEIALLDSEIGKFYALTIRFDNSRAVVRLTVRNFGKPTNRANLTAFFALRYAPPALDSPPAVDYGVLRDVRAQVAHPWYRSRFTALKRGRSVLSPRHSLASKPSRKSASAWLNATRAAPRCWRKAVRWRSFGSSAILWAVIFTGVRPCYRANSPPLPRAPRQRYVSRYRRGQQYGYRRCEGDTDKRLVNIGGQDGYRRRESDTVNRHGRRSNARRRAYRANAKESTAAPISLTMFMFAS